MSFLDLLSESDLKEVQACFHPVRFARGECLLHEGEPVLGCYLVDEGEVRVEVHSLETDSESVLGFLDPGMFLGDVFLFDDKPFPASAYAHTDVAAHWFAKEDFTRLCEQYPAIGVTILQAFSRDMSAKLRYEAARMTDYLFADEIDADTHAMVARAAAAQRELADWPEERIDTLLHAIAEAVAAQAPALSEACVQETGMGVAADKVIKIRFACHNIWQSLVDQPAAGRIAVNETRRVTEIASPMGVVFGIIPLTNPVSTFVFKTLICLKARNALILSCHRDALGVGQRTGEIIQAVLQQHSAPVDLVQWIRQRGSRRKTMMFMKHPGVAFILATGGPSMVKAAYSSGTPAIGVGAGNAPVWICADADLAAAAQMIVHSKAFDNGVICGSENNLVVEASVHAAFVDQLEACGGRLLTPQEKEGCAQKIFDFDNHTVHRALVGKSAQFIAQQAELPYDKTLRLLVVPAAVEEMSGPYGREKLAPVLSLFTAHGETDGLEICEAILAQEGSGHTAIIHTRSQALAEQFSLRMPVSRILVNMPGTEGCIGLGNGLTPSLTLGCGTYGRNSVTDNVTYTHLLNIKRMSLSLG
jgi:acyl-CoA reductase-like NAD-dependent aldehyde dehydrogenase